MSFRAARAFLAVALARLTNMNGARGYGTLVLVICASRDHNWGARQIPEPGAGTVPYVRVSFRSSYTTCAIDQHLLSSRVSCHATSLGVLSGFGLFSSYSTQRSNILANQLCCHGSERDFPCMICTAPLADAMHPNHSTLFNSSVASRSR